MHVDGHFCSFLLYPLKRSGVYTGKSKSIGRARSYRSRGAGSIDSQKALAFLLVVLVLSGPLLGVHRGGEPSVVQSIPVGVVNLRFELPVAFLRALRGEARELQQEFVGDHTLVVEGLGREHQPPTPPLIQHEF